MSYFFRWAVTVAVPALAVLVLVAGCIPSAPDPKSEPSPAVIPSAPPANGVAAKPTVKNETLPPDKDGKPQASLKIGPADTPNVSVTVESMKDGPGFLVRGTFNLSGRIVPNGAGKWKFTGQFSVAEPDFAIGTPVTSAMGSFGAASNGGAMKMDAAMIMIDIPVRPPSAQAPEGTAPRIIPVSVDMDAPEKAQFTVSLTQM